MYGIPEFEEVHERAVERFADAELRYNTTRVVMFSLISLNITRLRHHSTLNSTTKHLLRQGHSHFPLLISHVYICIFVSRYWINDYQFLLRRNSRTFLFNSSLWQRFPSLLYKIYAAKRGLNLCGFYTPCGMLLKVSFLFLRVNIFRGEMPSFPLSEGKTNVRIRENPPSVLNAVPGCGKVGRVNL